MDDVLRLVARRLDVTVHREGSLVFIGAEKPGDRAVMVRRVRRLKLEAIKESLSVIAVGKTASFADGLIVVSDTVEVIKRVNQMFDLVEATETPVWIVQLHLVTYSQDAADELGINIEPAAKAGLAFAIGSAGGIGSVAAGGGKLISGGVSGSLDAVLAMAHSRAGVSVSAAPMFLLSDGSKSSFVQGDKIPLPRRSVSDQGTVSINGYDYIQTGVQVELALRETSAASASISTTVKISDQKGLVGEAAITGEQNFTTEAVVRAGGVYLLGTLAKDRTERGTSLGWVNNFKAADNSQVVQVWLQCYRVGSDAAGVRDVAPRVLPVAVPPSPPSDAGRDWQSVPRAAEPTRAVPVPPVDSVYLRGKATRDRKRPVAVPLFVPGLGVPVPAFVELGLAS